MVDMFSFRFINFQQPMFLLSPAMVLSTRHGDAFDYATLLCSLLLGAGFDAYVVYGYATKRMTLKDEQRMKAPPIQHEDKVSEHDSRYVNLLSDDCSRY